jgi:hypothetical protein
MRPAKRAGVRAIDIRDPYHLSGLIRGRTYATH